MKKLQPACSGWFPTPRRQIFQPENLGKSAISIGHGPHQNLQFGLLLGSYGKLIKRFAFSEYFFAAHCDFAVHTIDNELGESSQIKSVVRTSLAFCSTVYITTSFFGYLLFGDSTLDDVLANFDSNLGIPCSSLINDIVRVSYAFHLMLVFPIIFFPLRFNLDGLLFPSAEPLGLDNRRFALITAGLISIVFLGANFIPSIWDAFQFTGATAAVCIGFIFPAAITLRWVLQVHS